MTRLFKHYSALSILCFGISLSLIANTQAQTSTNTAQTLSEKAINDLKTDIVELNAEFKNLEEQYFYPDAVSAALFISLDTGQFFTLESIEAQVDEKPVIGHFYTEKQLVALQKGGIQRLGQFTLKPGPHDLVITVVGKNENGDTIKRGITKTFDKTNAAIGLELKIKDSVEKLAVELELKTWQL